MMEVLGTMKTTLRLCLALVGFVFCLSCSGAKNDCLAKRTNCAAPLVCDPGDGICKCGGRGGVICPEGFACDAQTNTCQSSLCAKVTCGGGTSCDVNDGKCKCGGTGGKVCEAS